MIDFGRDFFGPGGKHHAPKNIHTKHVGEHLCAVIAHETGAMLQKGGPKVIETDQDNQGAEAFHEKGRSSREPFLPIDRKNKPIFFHPLTPVAQQATALSLKGEGPQHFSHERKSASSILSTTVF